MIHPTALVHPGARLADDVEVGPFTLIGEGVSIGAGTRIGSHAVIKGHTRIGAGNRIYQFTSIGEDPQDKKYLGEDTRLEIGDHNVIREFATLHRGTVQDRGITRIGDHNLLMAYTHVAHDCDIGNGVILANAASLAGHVQVSDYAILGGFSLVHQFCKIGKYSFSAMGSVISRDIPPYIVVGGQPTKPHGINSVGLERRGFTPEVLMEIRRAYKVLYKMGHTLEEAIALLADMATRTPELACMVEFLRSLGRSIIR